MHWKAYFFLNKKQEQESISYGFKHVITHHGALG